MPEIDASELGPTSKKGQRWRSPTCFLHPLFEGGCRWMPCKFASYSDMYLPPPTYTFTLPSVYDGIQLDCRLHIPHQLSEPKGTCQGPIRGAIVAHPYATLGGCYDDPVVDFAGSELLEAGYVLGTFNFRYFLSCHLGQAGFRAALWP